MKHNNNQKTEVKNLCCPNCQSQNIKKNGKRKTENRGLIQRYQCRDCNYRFTYDDGFFRMRNSPQKITCGLDLFYRGVSTRKVQEHFKAFYPHNASNVSVYNWVVRYAKMISGFTDKLKIKGGSEVQVDEMEYHRRFSLKTKKKVSKDWFIDSIDCKTRYMVGCEYVKSRGKKEIREVLGKVKYKTEGYVTTITTDGLLAYTNIVKQVFGYYNFQSGEMKHEVNIASKGGCFNIYIERLHNSIRQRTDSFRGFHGSVESADAIMKGWEIFYNFIRKHQSIKCCPYELATDLKLESGNKWLELIMLSKKSVN